jgi:hypothetical protein
MKLARPPIPPKKRTARAEAKCFRCLGIKTSKQNNFQFLLRKIWRAGVKKLKENCFALLVEVRRAETLGGISARQGRNCCSKKVRASSSNCDQKW